MSLSVPENHSLVFLTIRGRTGAVIMVEPVLSDKATIVCSSMNRELDLSTLRSVIFLVSGNIRRVFCLERLFSWQQFKTPDVEQLLIYSLLFVFMFEIE